MYLLISADMDQHLNGALLILEEGKALVGFELQI